MAMKDIHEYLADALIKEVSVFGRDRGAERISKCLAFWEVTYGAAITDKARKIIVADWRKRFKARGSGLGPSHRGGGPDGSDSGPAEVPADAVDESARCDGQLARRIGETPRELGSVSHVQGPR